MVTSRPFFLKMPASFASVSGAKPVHPEMPTPTLTSSASTGVETVSAMTVANTFELRMIVVLSPIDGLTSC